MSVPTDLSVVAVERLHAGDPVQAAVYARLACAQQTKASNLIAYLNSDRETWSVEDEDLVRAYLGLSATDEDSPTETAADSEESTV